MSHKDITIIRNSVIIKFKYDNDRLPLLWKELIYYNKKYVINEYIIHFSFEKDLSIKHEKNITADLKRIVCIKDFHSFIYVWDHKNHPPREWYHYLNSFQLELVLINLESKYIRKRYIPKIKSLQ